MPTAPQPPSQGAQGSTSGRGETYAGLSVVQPAVALVGYTVFHNPGWFPEWQTDASNDAGKLIEFAGRMCYQSWNNALGRTNRQYIENILEHEHFSVIEHVSVSLAIRGVSRSLTHELVRHRHFSFSQLSQRYVSEDEANIVLPVDLEGQALAEPALQAARAAQEVYRELVAGLSEGLRETVTDRTARRKLARQAARAVLPNMTETQLVVSGNLRAWATFLKKRGTEHAEPEIRRLAILIWSVLGRVAPEIFDHFHTERLADGRQVLLADVDFE